MADKTVKIGCRIPNGVILRPADWVDTPDGKVLKDTEPFELRGSGAHLGQAGSMHAEGDEAGVTYTEVPADAWDKWYAANKDSDLVTSGAVFKGKARAKVADEAPVDPVQAEAEAQRAVLGEQVSPDPKADAAAGKLAAKTAKTV